MNKLVAPSAPRLNLLSWRQNQQLLQWQGWQVRLWLSALVGAVFLTPLVWQIFQYHQKLQQLNQQQISTASLLAARQTTVQQQLQQLNQYQQQMQQQRLISVGLLALLDSLPTEAWLQRRPMVDGCIEVDLILPEQWHQWWEQIQQLPWWDRAQLLNLSQSELTFGWQLQARLFIVPVRLDDSHG